MNKWSYISTRYEIRLWKEVNCLLHVQVGLSPGEKTLSHWTRILECP